jgi:hypothetical protein
LPARVLFVGFDALDSELVREWAAAGVLPTFRSLFENSAFGATKNPPGFYGGAVSRAKRLLLSAPDAARRVHRCPVLARATEG